ncbi:MAG: FHA domain-containing protein, partial [Planctomycetota bacterium]|nr:FHA domain-containing protein [Planctomycetota bacterium]
MIRLILRQRGEERHVEYAALPITVGRNPDTTIHVDEKMVSRLHARIEDTPQGVMLRDVESANGTFVNRIRVKEALLKSGDVIKIGDTEMVWVGSGGAQADASPKPAVVPAIPMPTIPSSHGPAHAAEVKPAPPAAALAPAAPVTMPRPVPEAAHAKVEHAAPPVIPFPTLDDRVAGHVATGAPQPPQIEAGAPHRVEPVPPAPQPVSPDARALAASRQQRLLLWLEDIKRALYIVMAVGILVVVGFVAREQFFSEGDGGDDKSGTRKRQAKSTTDGSTSEGLGSDMAADLQREAETKRREKEKHAAQLADAKRKAEEEERKQAAIMEEKRKTEEERLARIEEEKRRQEKEMAAALEAEKVKAAPLYAAVGELVRKYNFDKAIAMCNSAREEILDVSLRAEIAQRAQEIEALRAMFENMLQRMKSGQVVLELTDTVSVQIENGDAEKWSGSTAGGAAKITQRWTDTKPRAVVSIFLSASPSPGELFCLGLFCYEHGLIEEAEEVLIDCYKKDSERKSAIDQLIARARQVAVPEGGFLLYKGSWVTAEEKSYLERGYVKYDGKWMTEDEMMTAKGYVKHEGRWITQEEKEKIEKREAELAALKLKLQPKGLIDKPGADTEAIPWAKAQELKTANYRVKSNLSPEALRDCA